MRQQEASNVDFRSETEINRGHGITLQDRSEAEVFMKKEILIDKDRLETLLIKEEQMNRLEAARVHIKWPGYADALNPPGSGITFRDAVRQIRRDVLSMSGGEPPGAVVSSVEKYTDTLIEVSNTISHIMECKDRETIVTKLNRILQSLSVYQKELVAIEDSEKGYTGNYPSFAAGGVIPPPDPPPRKGKKTDGWPPGYVPHPNEEVLAKEKAEALNRKYSDK